MSNTGHNGTVDERLDALRSTAAADDRLRLIHLFMWTALVAACLAFSRWIGEPYPKSETRNFIVITWLSIAWATALAVFPWLVARRRRKPSSPLQPGERLWVIMGLFSLLRAGAVWGHDLLKIAGELLLSGGYD